MKRRPWDRYQLIAMWLDDGRETHLGYTLTLTQARWLAWRVQTMFKPVSGRKFVVQYGRVYGGGS